jgi:hypothetical protein
MICPGGANVFATKDACPLCGSDAQRIDVAADDVQHFKDCPKCKEYKIGNGFLARIRAWRAGANDPHVNEDLLSKLSIAARRASERDGQPVLITEETAGAVAN